MTSDAAFFEPIGQAIAARAIQDAIETGIFTALVTDTTGEDDDEWLDSYARPRVKKWTTEIMRDKLGMEAKW